MDFLGFSTKSDDKGLEKDYEEKMEADIPSVSSKLEDDSYKVVSSEINEDQAERIVQKLLKRK